METKFLEILTGFQKNHNTQHALLRMIKTWKSQLNKRNKTDLIIIDHLWYLTP